MQQLIYTSAPRLLESGKTGFGTVSCSRGMPKPLISYLERISTFDREAGVSSLDYYSCFRMGSAHFHVFSRVSDAGADYTGRTNHLAQHFVVEEGTIEYTLMMPSTPAGALIALDACFLSEWNGQPVYLEEEQTPPSVPSNSFYTWQRCTGQSDNARWLAASYYLNSCCLSADVSARCALELFHDGLLHREDHGWGMGLCTAVVRNLSSGKFPISFLSAEQRIAGVRCGAGAHLLSTAPALQPPTEADMPTVVVPMVPVLAQEPVTAIDASAPAAPLSNVPPSLDAVSVPIIEAGHQEPPPHVRCSREKRKGDNQVVLLVAGLSVVALGLLAWNMTSAKEQVKAVSPKLAQQTPDPAEPENIQKMPKLSPKLPSPEKPTHKEPLKDFTLPEMNRPTEEIMQPLEKDAHKEEEKILRGESNAQVAEKNQPEPAQKTETPLLQTGEERPLDSVSNQSMAEPADDAQEKKTLPQTISIPDCSVSSIMVTITTKSGSEEHNFAQKQETLNCLSVKNGTDVEILVTICFDGVNEKVQECLNGDINCDHILEKIERKDLGERIENAHKEFAAKKRTKNSQENNYQTQKKKFSSNPILKKDYPEAMKALEVDDFKKAQELLMSNKKLSAKLQKNHMLYQELRTAEKDFQTAEKKMEEVVNYVFSLKETVKLKFTATQQPSDKYIEITTELIEAAPKK